jgi:hypothetical protein
MDYKYKRPRMKPRHDGSTGEQKCSNAWYNYYEYAIPEYLLQETIGLRGSERPLRLCGSMLK